MTSDSMITATKAAVSFDRTDAKGSLNRYPRDGHDDGLFCSRLPDSGAEEYTIAFARGYARGLDASIPGSFSPPPTSIGHVARLGLDQLVANAPHSLNPRRAVAQLFPKPGHMN